MLSACHLIFLVGSTTSLRWGEESDDYAELYITLLGEKNNTFMGDLSWRQNLKDVVTPLVQPFLAGKDRFSVVRKIPATRDDKYLYVVECIHWFKPDGPERTLSQAVLDKVILDNKNQMPEGLVPEGCGEVTGENWLRPLWDRCSTPQKKLGRVRHMDLQIKLPANKAGYILTTCDVEMFTEWGARDEYRSTCQNTRKVITKVRGAGMGTWMKIFKMPIQMSWTNDVKYWTCSFWDVPDRWGDEKSPGAQKLCSVDKTVSYTCTWTDSRRGRNSFWDFTGYSYFLSK